MTTIYGIKNCNTMKKAFDFLNEHQIAYQFFDYKKQTLSRDEFDKFVTHLGLEKVINKQGTTYKKLSDDDKAILASGEMTAIYELVTKNQSMIKRPILVLACDKMIAGFDEKVYQTVFEKA